MHMFWYVLLLNITRRQNQVIYMCQFCLFQSYTVHKPDSTNESISLDLATCHMNVVWFHQQGE